MVCRGWVVLRWPEFALDYYNSFVIRPTLVEILEVCKDRGLKALIDFYLSFRRMQRYNVLLERLVSPEATFPSIGRSITYRMGVFQTLALSIWKYEETLLYVMTSNSIVFGV